MSRRSVAVISQAVGPPWIDGMINSMVATARAMPDYEFHWFGDRSWSPAEPHFRSSQTGTVGSWAISDKLRFGQWVKSLDVDLAHVIFHPRPATVRMLRPLLGDTAIVQTLQTRQPAGTDLQRVLLGGELVTVTNRIAADVHKALPTMQVEVIPPAIDADQLPRSVEKDAIRVQYGVGGVGPLIIYAGNYTPGPGVLDAADVFAGIADRSPDAELCRVVRQSLPAQFQS